MFFCNVSELCDSKQSQQRVPCTKAQLICSAQAGSMRRPSGISCGIPVGTVVAAQLRAAVGIDLSSASSTGPGVGSSGTVQPTLAFERVQEVLDTHPQGVPLLSLLTVPWTPSPEEAVHLEIASPSPRAIQVPTSLSPPLPSLFNNHSHSAQCKQLTYDSR